MNREEMKKMLPIIQAYVDGKTIQWMDDCGWHDINNIIDSAMLDMYAWRIKPEPKYRPFKDAEECWNEMLKHQPFGWVKKTDDEPWYENLTTVMSMTVWFNTDDDTSNGMSYEKAMNEYTFADGAPFGIKDE